jgi:hypothetical protein
MRFILHRILRFRYSVEFMSPAGERKRARGVLLLFTRFVQRLRKEKRRMKSKFVFGLLATMLILALAPSSFAQVNITIFPNGSPQEVGTNRTAETADPRSSGAGLLVSGALVAQSSLSTTELIIDYPARLTSGVTALGDDVPAGDDIRIVAASGVFAGAVITTRNYVTGTLTISLIGAADIPVNNQSGSFRIVGPRIDANGLTAPVNATASLTSTANNFILSTPSFTVINALGAGIATVAQGGLTSGSDLGTATIFTNRNVSDATASILITEGFDFAWRSEAQNEIDSPGAAGVGATQIRLTVTGLATGITATVSAQTSGTGTLAVTGGGTVTATANTTTFTIANSNPAAAETLQVNFSFSAPTSTPTVGAITVTATMAPIGVAHTANDVLSTDPVPRFAAAEVGPVTVATVAAAATNLLVPFAVRDGGFDTGIALANTSADPFGTAGGGAVATAGAVVLNFFPRAATGGAGTSFVLTTSPTVRPGVGLSADGTLAAGATWTVLLSELLTAAGQTGAFTGYIFIRADFLGAHGAPFVSDFRNFTSFTPMLVMPQPLARNAVESLGL